MRLIMAGMEFYSDKTLRAKKPHPCELCGKQIMPGEVYGRESGKYDGDFFDRCLHVHCQNMEHEYCHEVDNEFTWEAITDYIQDINCSSCDCNEDSATYVEGTQCPGFWECGRLKAKYGG